MTMNAERASALMRRDGIDGLVSATLENNFYLSGVWVDGQELFPLDSESYVVTTADRPDEGVVVCSIGSADLTLGGYPTLGGVTTFGTFFRDIGEGAELDRDEQRVAVITEAHETGRTPAAAIIETIRSLGLADGTIAIDERGPNRTLLAEIAEALPQARILPASKLFREIRAVKTEDEIAAVTAALRVTEAGLRAAFAEFRTGVSELDVKLAFETTVAAAGGRTGFMLVRFGKGIALGQVPASADRTLAAGDIAFFDVGINLHGYKSDIGRLVSFGEPGPQIRELYAASKAGQQAAIDMMKPGVVAHDIFTTAVETVKAAGIPGYRRQHVGHGIGIEYYDLPVLAPGSETPLEAGMVFEVETPYYRMGVGGAFVEDTVLVTESGSTILTELDRELVVIEP